MDIRLLAFDLDGTTLLKNAVLPERNREALLEAHRRGAVLVPATGRMRGFIPHCITELPVGYIITSNGGVVYDMADNEHIIENLIDNKTAIDVQNILDSYDVYIEYYTGGEAITKTGMPEKSRTHYGMPEVKWTFVDSKGYTFTDDFGRMLVETGLCPEKINLPYLPKRVRGEIWKRLSTIDGIRLTSSVPDNIEINSAAANKGGALRELCRMLDIPMEQVMALGDNGNDVTMLEAAGVSAAMKDGSEDAKAAATLVTAAHDDSGLAEAICKVFGFTVTSSVHPI